jgi:hypothetical protein
MSWLKKTDDAPPPELAHGYWSQEEFNLVASKQQLNLTVTKCASVFSYPTPVHEFTAIVSSPQNRKLGPIKCTIEFSRSGDKRSDNNGPVGSLRFNGFDADEGGFWDGPYARKKPVPPDALRDCAYIPQIDLLLSPNHILEVELIKCCREALSRGHFVPCRIILSQSDWTWEHFKNASSWTSHRISVENFIFWSEFNFEKTLGQSLR